MAYGSPPLTGYPYVTPAQLPNYGVQQSALNRVSNDVQLAACMSASTRADSFIGDRYPLPLVAFDIDLVTPVAHIAIWICLSNVGRNPGAGYDDQIDERYKEALHFLGEVARQTFRLNVLVNQPPPPMYNLPAVRTHRRRGW
jgi:phage gp36-like protein